MRCAVRLGAAALTFASGAAAVGVDPVACPGSATPASKPATAAAEALARGDGLASRGDHAGALDAFEVARGMADADGDTVSSLLASASAARSEAVLGRGEASAKRLDALEQRIDALPDARLRARLRIHAGRTFAQLALLRRAAELLETAGEEAAETDAWRLRSYAQGYLGELYLRRHRSEEALSLTRRALFWAERAEAADAIYRWHWQVGRIELARGDARAAIAAYRASAATLRRARGLGPSDTQPVYDGLVGLLLSRAATAEGEARQSLLAEVRSVLEDSNVSELRDYFRDACLDARRKAAPDTVAGTLVVYPVLLEDSLVLISSLDGVLDLHDVPVSRGIFVEEVREFRRSLENRTNRHYRRHAERLYEWLIAPLESALSGGGVETLVFVPRGALNTIPLAALRDRASGRFLIEKVPLAITPGLTLTDPKAIDRASAQLLAAGVSESVQGFPALGFVTHEIGDVSGIFPGEKLLDREFVASAFEREVARQPFDIVHVASHGVFSADVSESYVLTYDGRISMDRLADLVGKTRFRERGLELLTLSACETAAGDDRAALGLAGVALSAGARSAVATLWAIDDDVSAELMVEFYRQLRDPKQGRAAALRSAQLAVLRQHAYRHPAYWAPYLLINSWL